MVSWLSNPGPRPDGTPCIDSKLILSKKVGVKYLIFQHELLVDKYSKEMSVGDILEMYPDPEDYFGKLDRKVSDLYKKLSLAHLKREFRQIGATPITQVN